MERGRLARIINKLNALSARFLVWIKRRLRIFYRSIIPASLSLNKILNPFFISVLCGQTRINQITSCSRKFFQSAIVKLFVIVVDYEWNYVIFKALAKHNQGKRRFIHTLGMERGRLARIINKLNARHARFLVWIKRRLRLLFSPYRAGTCVVPYRRFRVCLRSRSTDGYLHFALSALNCEH